MESVLPYFSKEHLVKLNRLRLNIKGRLSGGYSGAQKSNAKGDSLEFSDFRDYYSGDDFRRIDWNSYGRLDRLFIKLFVLERQSNFNIIIDNSVSMDYGDDNKAYFAKILAGSIAYMALNNSDMVNLYTCYDTITPKKVRITSANMFYEFLEAMDSIEFKGKTNMNHSLKHAQKAGLTSGVTIILSDMYSQDGFEEGLKLLQSLKQDVVLFHVLAKEEIFPGKYEAVRFLDSETHHYRDLIITDSVLKEYNAALVNFQNEIQSFCKSRGIKYHFTSSDTPVLKLLTNRIGV